MKEMPKPLRNPSTLLGSLYDWIGRLQPVSVDQLAYHIGWTVEATKKRVQVLKSLRALEEDSDRYLSRVEYDLLPPARKVGVPGGVCKVNLTPVIKPRPEPRRQNAPAPLVRLRPNQAVWWGNQHFSEEGVVVESDFSHCTVRLPSGLEFRISNSLLKLIA